VLAVGAPPDPGARTLGEGAEAERVRFEIDGETAYVWIVPAR
jgi:hypothetical protein